MRFRYFKGFREFRYIQAYRNEKDADGRERILLIRRVRTDKKEASTVAEKEFHRSRWWAYKWLKRFDNTGLEIF
jgi:hypothetical protein